MRPILSVLGLVGLGMMVLTGAGCRSDSSNSYATSPTAPSPTNSSPGTVQMAGMAFAPATITVSAGTTVTWRNDDGYVHTATSDTGVWDTGNVDGGGSASFKFNSPGTFPYHCTFHASMGMKGTVIVK